MGLFTSTKKVRYAVVGIGWFAQDAVLPGFANAKNAELVALVSGDPKKHEEITKQYGVPAYTYEQYDELMASGKVDAVYIVLPNAMHKDYTIRAAKHKVHVLCEKPLAADAQECRDMIAACEANGVQLMTAYRLHLEHGNLAAIELARPGGKLGESRLFQSSNVQYVEDNSTRLDGDLAGGPLMDLGVYCINAARYMFQADPTEVTAFTVMGTEERFQEVPEMVAAVMKFPGDRLATFTCGFNQGKVSEFRLFGTKGSLVVDPAFSFTGPKTITVEIDKQEPRETEYEGTDHVGAEIAYFADCVLNNKTPEPDGYEGLADMMIIDAIKESSKTGRAVKVGPFKDKPRPEKSMEYKFPEVTPKKRVHAQSPSGE